MEKEYYITKEQFNALKPAWKAKSSHSAKEMIIYNILRSKPADNGFCPKTKNIQGNDEWYGYKEAWQSAKWFCEPDHIMIDDKTIISRLTGQFGKKWIFDVEPTKKRFKEMFGIDMPEDILAKIEEAKK